MSQNTLAFSKKSSIEMKRIPFSEIPHQSNLFLDYQSNSPKIDKFYSEKHTPLEQLAEKVLGNYKVDREKLCDILLEENKRLGGTIKTFINIRMLRQNDCLAIVTGQQAGLFTGPIYTIYKALSAIKLAKDLKCQNIKAVPVFWIAEEDHDFDEVNKTFLLDEECKLNQFKNSPQNYEEGIPVGYVEFDISIEKTIENLFTTLLPTEFTSEIKKIIEETYQIGETYSSAFAKLLAGILKDYGIIMLPPLNKKLKQLCSPIFADAIKHSEAINSEILEKNKKLEAENYHTQVLVDETSYPFFLQDRKNKRKALRQNLESGKVIIQKSKEEIEKSELLEVAEKFPHFLSPNALMRPVVQDYLLPTLLYFGGGAEIAYFAQNSAIYETLDRPVTPILHRSSFSIISGKQRRNLNKYKLNFTDLFEGEEKISARIVEEFLSNDVALTFAEVEEKINKQLKYLEKSLSKTEPTLAENAANRRQKIMWHIAALRKKYHSAEILKDEVAQRRIKALFSELLPGNSLQERSLNVITFLNLYGMNFIKWLYEAVDTEEKDHQLLIL